MVFPTSSDEVERFISCVRIKRSAGLKKHINKQRGEKPMALNFDVDDLSVFLDLVETFEIESEMNDNDEFA